MQVLDFREGRDEVRRIEYMFAEVGENGEEAKGCCISVGGCLKVTTHGAKSGVLSGTLEERVDFAGEADSAVCKKGRVRDVLLRG